LNFLEQFQKPLDLKCFDDFLKKNGPKAKKNIELAKECYVHFGALDFQKMYTDGLLKINKNGYGEYEPVSTRTDIKHDGLDIKISFGQIDIKKRLHGIGRRIRIYSNKAERNPTIFIWEGQYKKDSLEGYARKIAIRDKSFEHHIGHFKYGDLYGWGKLMDSKKMGKVEEGLWEIGDLFDKDTSGI
jgi:hypothetical protein